MTVLVDQNGQQIEVPENMVIPALATGNLSAPEGMQIPVVDAFGKISKIDPSSLLTDATKYGLQVVPESRWDAHVEKKEFGDKGIQAGLAGLARGATFSLSDVLARAAGGKEAASYLDKLEKYNPNISTASNIAGAVIPAFLTGGESTLANVAEMAPTNLVAEGGHAVGHALAETPLVKALAEGGLLSQVAAKAIPRAASMGLEAIPYGMAHGLSEEMLGDSDINASKLISHVGLNGLLTGGFGAALGGVVGTGEALIPKAWNKSLKFLDSTADSYKQAQESAAQTAVERSNMLPEEQDAANVFFKNPEARRLAQMSDIELEKRAYELTPKIQGVVDDFMEKNKLLSGEGIQSNAKILTSEVGADRARQGFNNILQDTQLKVNEMLADPFVYGKPIVSDLQDALASAQTNLSRLPEDANAADMFKIGQDFRQEFGSILKKYKTLASSDVKAMDFVRDFYGKFNEDYLRNPDIFGEKLASLKTKVDQFHSSNINEEYIKEFGKKIGSIEKSKNGFIDGITVDPVKVANTLKQSGKIRGPDNADIINDFFDRAKVQHEILTEMKQNAPSIKFNPDTAYEKLAQSKAIVDQQLQDTSYKGALAQLKSVKTPEMGFSPGNMIKGMTSNVPVLGSLTKAIPTAPVTPYGWVERLTKLDGFLKNVDQKIDGFIDRFLTGKGLSATEKFIAKSAIPVTSAAVDFGHHGALHTFMSALENDPEEYQKQLDKMGTQLADPHSFQNEIAKNSSQLFRFAPNMATNMAMKTMQSYNFLYGKAPKDPRGPMEKLITTDKWHPSDSDKFKMRQYAQAIDNPLIPVGELLSGRPTPEGMEVLNTIHKPFLDHVKQKVTQSIAQGNHKLSYSDRINLGNALGLPLDTSLSPGFAQAYSQIVGSKNQQPRLSGSASGKNKLSMNKSSMTGTQRIQMK
jgi:hypothetical protein